MIGKHAFCPTSGASLSREIHHDAQGRPERAPESDELAPKAGLEELLSTGKRRSSKRALVTYFRRCHRRHAESDDELDGRASLAITRFKHTATGREQLDVIMWYALAEHLKREGFDIEWMAGHVEPRCPNCGGRLAYETGPDGPIGRCGTSCAGDRRDRLCTIRELVVALARRTFSGEPTPDVDDFVFV